MSYLPLAIIIVLLALSFQKRELQRDTGSADQPPDLTLLVLLDRLRMGDIQGTKNVTSHSAFEEIEGVCRNPNFARTGLHDVAVRKGLRGKQLQDPSLVWQKWAEVMDDNEVKWRRETGEPMKAYPLFTRERSVSFELEQQRDGSWLATDVLIK